MWIASMGNHGVVGVSQNVGILVGLVYFNFQKIFVVDYQIKYFWIILITEVYGFLWVLISAFSFHEWYNMWIPWWHHQMETFSTLLAICAGNSLVPGEFSTQLPVARSFDVSFDLHPNKQLSKQWWGWWFETQSCPLLSQITSLTIVYSIIYSGANQRKYQSSALLAFVRGIHWSPVNSPHKGPVTQKMFPFDDIIMSHAWWRHQMETFSALLAICAGNSPVPGEFPTQRPVTRSFDVYFDLRPNKWLSKESWGWWFEALSWSLWRQRNGVANCYLDE